MQLKVHVRIMTVVNIYKITVWADRILVSMAKSLCPFNMLLITLFSVEFFLSLFSLIMYGFYVGLINWQKLE